MVVNMSGDFSCRACGYMPWLAGGNSGDVVTGEKCSYEECVKQEHIKLAKKMGCPLSSIYTPGEGRAYSRK